MKQMMAIDASGGLGGPAGAYNVTTRPWQPDQTEFSDPHLCHGNVHRRRSRRHVRSALPTFASKSNDA